MRLRVLALSVVLLFATQALAFQNNIDKNIRLKGKPSRLDLLQSKQQYFAENPVILATPDTINLLAIRVEFVPDTVSETTGDGTFDLSQPTQSVLNPPPHNKTYFDYQLQSLANYYNKVSNGNLVIQWDIFPEGENDAFRLNQQMQYYSPENNETVLDQRLAELLRDAIQTADQNAQIDFSAYESFIVFHAGVGNDINFDFDPSPNDIPSVFLNANDVATGLNVDDPENYPGIPVNGASMFVREGIILPETETQEGLDFGLLGTMTIMFGYQIGLPSLFNPETGGSGAGRFGLMDQGSGNFQGMLPAEPSAWEKVYMGWVNPITIYSGENFTVGAPQSNSTNQIYKIPINDDEYYLVENRQRDVNGDSLALGTDNLGNTVEFTWDESILATQNLGVILEVDEYDFGMPGSGILIWHINDRVIREKIDQNRINEDVENRGVDLEEGDGAQDFGFFYGFLQAGYGTENGYINDPWHADNEDNKIANQVDAPVFGPETFPDTRSAAGVPTGISIYGFSSNSAEMQFSVSRNFQMRGFPVYTEKSKFWLQGGEFDPNSAGFEIALINENNKLLIWRNDGSSLLPATETVSFEHFYSQSNFEIPVAFTFENAVATVPLIADLNADGVDELVVLQTNGELIALSAVDSDTDGQLDPMWTLQTGEQDGSRIMLSGGTIYIGGSELHAISASGDLLSTSSTASDALQLAATQNNIYALTETALHQFSSDLQTSELLVSGSEFNTFALVEQADQLLTAVVLNQAGSIILSGENAPEIQVPANYRNINWSLATGDVNGDGRFDIVLAGGSTILAYNANGALLENFPAQFGNSEGGISSAPLLLDADSDGAHEVFAVLASGQLVGIKHNGELVEGLPLSVSANSLGRHLSAFDSDGDDELEIATISDDGFLHIFDLPGIVANNSHAWHMPQGNNAQQRFVKLSAQPSDLTGDLLPENLVYNYPNPSMGNLTTIRYRLTDEATVKINIFDVAGDLVESFDGPGFGDMDNEINWQLSNIQNGVYIAHVEAKSSTKTETAIFKISVIK